MLDKLIIIFNNREISIFIWIVILLIWLFSQKGLRQSAISVIQAFFKLLKWYLLMLLYISGIVLLFYKLNLWDTSLLKNTIYWSLGGAFVLFFNINKALENDNHFLKIFKDCFKLIILVEFLSNLYSFNLIIELVSIPFLVFTGAMLALYENKSEYESVHKIFNGILIIYCVSVLVFSALKITKSENVFFTIENLKSLLFGSIMTLSLIPFLYFIAIYMAYEGFFKMKKFILKENIKLYRFLKWRIINRCHLNLKKIRLVNKKLHIYTSIEKEQIMIELNSIFK